jgi:hypothetical protein
MNGLPDTSLLDAFNTSLENWCREASERRGYKITYDAATGYGALPKIYVEGLGRDSKGAFSFGRSNGSEILLLPVYEKSVECTIILKTERPFSFRSRICWVHFSMNDPTRIENWNKTKCSGNLKIQGDDFSGILINWLSDVMPTAARRPMFSPAQRSPSRRTPKF